MVVYAKTRWTGTVAALVAAASAALFSSRALVLLTAGLALVAIVILQRMRLVADARGLTIVNLLGPHRIPWSEVSDFRLSRVALSTCLEVCTRDGRGVRAWAVTTTGKSAYSPMAAAQIFADLRQRLLTSG